MEYKEFKAVYTRIFILNPVLSMVSSTSEVEDAVLSSDSVKYAANAAYKLLQNSSRRQLGHLPVLSSYFKIMRRNHESGMTSTHAELAAVIFLLHQYCVRILCAPWRSDYLMFKAYSGFYQYTLCKILTPSSSERLMTSIGFQYNDRHDAFELDVSLNRSSRRRLLEAGLDCFLSYVQCVTTHDPSFKSKLQCPGVTSNQLRGLRSAKQVDNTDSQGSVELPQQKQFTMQVAQPPSVMGLETVQYPPMHAAQPITNGTLSSANVCYRISSNCKSSSVRTARNVPLNLSAERDGQWIGRDVTKTSLQSRRWPESLNDQSLYGGGNGHQRNARYDESISGDVLYPPTMHNYHERKCSLNTRMENCSCKETVAETRTQSLINSELHDDRPHTNFRYVKDVPTSSSVRGSPDGEIDDEAFRDHGKFDSTCNDSMHKILRKSCIYHET